MKTSVEHLPPRKQSHLARLVQVVREVGLAEMIVLFGSHARDDWVELVPARATHERALAVGCE